MCFFTWSMFKAGCKKLCFRRLNYDWIDCLLGSMARLAISGHYCYDCLWFFAIKTLTSDIPGLAPGGLLCTFRLCRLLLDTFWTTFYSKKRSKSPCCVTLCLRHWIEILKIEIKVLCCNYHVVWTESKPKIETWSFLD